MRDGRRFWNIGIVAAATTLLAACAAAPPSPDPDLVTTTKLAFERARNAQFECAHAAATAYAKNQTFLPQDVATAVISDCRAQSLAELEAYTRHTIAAHPAWPERTVQNSTSYYARGRDAATREQVVALVLRLRSGT